MKPGLVSGIIIAGLLALGFFLFVVSNDENNQNITQITAEKVATHNSSSDCWTIINGDVYDITSYIPRHPGGAEILRACGTDGSSLFNTRTTENGETVGSGTSHSSNAANQLSSLKIGKLAN